MSKKLVDKLFGGKPRTEFEDYVDLDTDESEEITGTEPAELYVRVADMSTLNELPELKKEVYNGNMVIVDISLLKRDKLNTDRAIKELKMVASDVHGDIAGLGEDKVIVTPTGVKIDRTKVLSSRY